MEKSDLFNKMVRIIEGSRVGMTEEEFQIFESYFLTLEKLKITKSKFGIICYTIELI